MIDITNVVNISVSAAPAGLAGYNVNNLLCLTKDAPIVAIGSDVYRVYTNPTDVGTDWGTTSATYKSAVAVFSQSPNILTGGGKFIIAPMLKTVTITPDVSVQQATIYTVTIGTTDFAFTSDASPTAAEVVTGLKNLINAGSTGVVATGTSTLILNNATYFAYTLSAKLSATSADETLTAALNRMKSLVYFGGVVFTFAPSNDAEVTDAAAVVEAARKLLFVGSSDATDMEAAGLFYVLQGSNFHQTRCIYHGDPAYTAKFSNGYAGRAMSTNFAGNNTTQNMHLKQIAGSVADSTVNSTVLGKAQAVGADVYVDIASRASLFTSGANRFFDDVYNLNWFVGALEVAGFNALATTSTKIPQTEPGMDYLKGEYRKICEQAVANAYAAPGEWTSADTFGDPETFKRNIREVGYFIYSQPVSAQNTADRAARKAPLIQIAIKSSGAINSIDTIVNINA